MNSLAPPSPEARQFRQTVLRRGLPLLALAALAGLGYWLAQPGEAVELNAVAGCDAQKTACVVEIPGAPGRLVTLQLSPDGGAADAPAFNVRVQVKDWAAQQAAVEFAGVDMNMGFNRTPLQAVAEQPGAWAGRTVLPVCITGPMRWKALLHLEGGRQRFVIHYRFDTGR